MLADLSMRFFKTEINPVRHIQGILNRGWISGQQVDPTYFKVIGKWKKKSCLVSIEHISWAYISKAEQTHQNCCKN